jgi:4-amino-4-deoxy-L-arabinose transferase-like glycosyltransferase
VVHTDAEITPPLYFLLAKLTTQVSLTTEMLRLPSLLAGVATIPLVYLVGVRTVGRQAALLASALAALSPFLIYYSAEARAYQLAVALTLGSTLALLRAAEGDGRGWWVLYAACTWTAMLTHYTAAFLLAPQAVWALWAHPGARRPVLLANLAAVLAYLPWLSGLRADFNSPTTEILSALSRFTPGSIRAALEHFTLGYPYDFVSLRSLPGAPALVLFICAIVLPLAVLAVARVRARRDSHPGQTASWRRPEPGIVLVAVLLLGPVLGEALASLVSTNVFGTRNLAVAWPALALALAAVALAPRVRGVRLAAAGVLIAAYAIGAAKMLDPDLQRPDFAAAAASIERQGDRSGVVIDGMVISPGPLSSLNVELDGTQRVIRAGVPQESDHPFNIFDPVAPLGRVVAEAAAASRAGGLLATVTGQGCPPNPGPSERQLASRLPPRFRLLGEEVFPGICPVAVSVFRDGAER